MEQYVALDVSLREISVCVIDANGSIAFEGKVAAEPLTLIKLIQARAPRAVRVGLETGAPSPWLFHEMKAAGLPVVMMDARHAHAALSMRAAKSDRSDARGLAEMLRMGWFRQVSARSLGSLERRTMLGAPPARDDARRARRPDPLRRGSGRSTSWRPARSCRCSRPSASGSACSGMVASRSTRRWTSCSTSHVRRRSTVLLVTSCRGWAVRRHHSDLRRRAPPIPS
jgi:hypothetical protein